MSSILFRIGNLFDIFENVTDAFSGNYSADNKEIVKMKHQLENEDVPTIGNDRQNLKADAHKVAGDYRKAFDVRKEELSL